MAATLYGEGGGGDAGRWGGDDGAGRSRGEPDKAAMMLATVARRGDGSGCGVARGGSRWRRRWTEAVVDAARGGWLVERYFHLFNEKKKSPYYIFFKSVH